MKAFATCGILAALLVVSLSATQLAGAGEKIDVVLASVSSPGSGWKQFRENPVKITLGKVGGTSGQSFAGTVLLSRLPAFKSKEEFFALVSRQRSRDSGDARFEDLVRNETGTVQDGVWVVRFHTKFKDFGAVANPQAAPYLVVDEFGAVFRHPFENEVSVYVALSQRSMPQDLDNTFEKVAEAFIRSVEFRSAPTR